MHPTHIGIHIHMRVAAGAAALDIGIMLRSDARDRNTEWKPYLYQGPGARTHGFDPARPREQNSAAPPTHHHTPTKQQAKRETQDGRTCPPAHMHPPAHMRAHLQQYDHSHSALARHSSASTSQHESPPHLCSAAHPSHIPLAPEGRAIADSQAYASYCIRLSSQRTIDSYDHRNAKFLIPPWQAVLAIK